MTDGAGGRRAERGRSVEESEPVVIRRIERDEVLRLQDQIVDVYADAFGPPPYSRGPGHAASFRESLARHAGRAGFRCVVALDAHGAVLGFTYGYTGAPGQWWTDCVRAGMPPALAARWMDGHFELVELAVRPEAQGRGIGARLHDTLLEGLPHRTALLSTIEAETRALHLYRRRGWVVLLTHFFFPNVPEPYLILGLDLAARRGG